MAVRRRGVAGAVRQRGAGQVRCPRLVGLRVGLLASRHVGAVLLGFKGAQARPWPREHGVVGDMRDAWPNARVRKNVSLIHTYHGFKGKIH
ncbi:DNAse I-like superfamily protein [Zea mays]|uniref:DNAse I-like superfamily protein n=1 Tax=Zea mays TaxID=4577 RepID=A0A1D6EE83_MAIZE|nr:DNAse I-like superfamily protein [Zea mays]